MCIRDRYYALLGQFTIREYGGESVAVVALLHDVCKTGYYRRERDGKYLSLIHI